MRPAFGLAAAIAGLALSRAVALSADAANAAVLIKGFAYQPRALSHTRHGGHDRTQPLPDRPEPQLRSVGNVTE